MVFFPNCKINIGLQILEKRSDGFHNLETLLYPADICDILEIVKKSKKEFPKDTEDSLSVTGHPIACLPKQNLIIKSLNLLRKDYPNIPLLNIFLHKVIPDGAGLGGGSSDAAFFIKGINQLFSLGLSCENMQEYAKKIGSDCAFFIENKAIFGLEKGDIFQKVPEEILCVLKDYRIELRFPGIRISTKEAYERIIPHANRESLFNLLKEPVEEWKNLISNDFDLAFCKAYPKIQAEKDKLYQEGAVYASMSGSGSAVYGLFRR